jgi:hypothetical protein
MITGYFKGRHVDFPAFDGDALVPHAVSKLKVLKWKLGPRACL